MIQRFRNFTVLNIALLIVFAVFMRISVFNIPNQDLNFSLFEPFARLMIHIESINSIGSEFNLVLALIITLVQAMLVNQIINNHILFGKPNLLPALSYVLVCSMFPQFLVLSAPLLCNFLLIWMFQKVVKLSRAGNPLAMMFDMGLITAVGTLIYFPFIGMFLAVLLGLMLFRPFYWREWFSGLFGFCTVYLFIAVFYYWNNNFASFLEIFRPISNKFSPNIPFLLLKWNDYLPLAPLALILMLCFWRLRQNFYNSFVSTRKTYQWLLFVFIISLLTFYLKPGFSLTHFVMCVPAAAIFVAYYFNYAQKKWFYEPLFWIFVLIIQYFQFV